MSRIMTAAVLAARGSIHRTGFAPWRRGAQSPGLSWLIAALGFLVGAAAIAQGAAWGLLVVAGTAAFSIVLCVGAAPRANAGFVVDVVILSVIVVLHAQVVSALPAP